MRILNITSSILLATTFWMIFDEYLRISARSLNLMLWFLSFCLFGGILIYTCVYTFFKKKYMLKMYKKSVVMVFLSLAFCYLHASGQIDLIKFKLSLPYLNEYVAMIEKMSPEQRREFSRKQAYEAPTAGAKIALFNFYQVELSRDFPDIIYFVNGYSLDPYGFAFDKKANKNEELAKNWRIFD